MKLYITQIDRPESNAHQSVLHTCVYTAESPVIRGQSSIFAVGRNLVRPQTQ